MAFYGMIFDWEYERTKAAELAAKKAAEAEAAKPKRPRIQPPAPRPNRPRYAREMKDIDFNYLQRELDNIRSSSGESLYDHIKSVFEHLILHSPEKALDRFEEISYMIKHKLDINEFLRVEDCRDYKPVAATANDYTSRMQPHFA